jgi:hypothetical protein
MDESNWQKQLLIGLVMLLLVGGLLGVVLAVAGLKAADLVGLSGEAKHTTRSNERLHIPRHVSTSTPAPTTPTAPQSTPTSRRPHSTAPRRSISLRVSPTSVGTYQRINLSGTYNAPTGTSLQVQRKENGAWTDFPTATHVGSGSFATYIETGHTGPNVLRVIDKATGRSSNVVTVQVR